MSVNHITVWTSASNLTICGQDEVEAPSCEFWSTGYTKRPFLFSVHICSCGTENTKFYLDWSSLTIGQSRSHRTKTQVLDSSYHKNEALVEIKNNSLSSRVSLFPLQYTWHFSLAFRGWNASEKCHVYSNRQGETQFEREWCCVSTFISLLPGVSEKSDEFKTCIFRVVLGIECRIGYQVRAYSKIFCLSEDPPHGVTWLRRAGHIFVMTHFSLEE